MKEKIYRLLAKPYAVVLVMLFSPLLGFIDRNFVFFFGLGVAFLVLRKSNYDWSKFGLGKRINITTVFNSLILAALLVLAFSIIDPILEHYLGKYDLSSLEDIKHNLVGYIVLMIIMWVFAAFGEEFLFRGYFMKGLAELLGNSNKAWILSAFIVSVYFGISHFYQGTPGMVGVTLFSFCISMIFNKNRDNLILIALIHGFYDSVFITLLFLDKELIISSWVQQMFLK